jgi:O-succinylbenzoate synthase
MDHALGQLCAAYEAAKAKLSVHCGLLTHLVYAEDPFFRQLSHHHGTLLPPNGTGFGFDKELAELDFG